MYRRRLGQFGEDLVVKWYESGGYRIVARNWRCREGEIDIVVAIDDILVFCEVKTRSSTAFGSPFDAVTPAKQMRVRRIAMRFLAQHNDHCPEIRFDAASVMKGTVEVLEGVF